MNTYSINSINEQYGDYCKMATIFLMLQNKKGVAMARIKTSCAKTNAIKNLMAFVMK